MNPPCIREMLALSRIHPGVVGQTTTRFISTLISNPPFNPLNPQGARREWGAPPDPGSLKKN